MYKLILNSSLLLAGMVFAQTGVQAQKTVTTSTVMEYTKHPGDSGGPLTEYIDISRGGKSYKIVRVGDKIKEFYVDGRRISEEHIADYRVVIKEIEELIQKDREQAEEDRAQAEEDRAQAEEDRAQAEGDRVQAKEDKEQAERDREEAVKDREQVEREHVQAKEEREQAEQERVQALDERQQVIRDKEMADLDRREAEKDKMRADREKKEVEKGILFYKQKMRNLAGDLVKDRILRVKSDLSSLSLSDKEMIVNGKLLAADLHEHYKKKYNIRPGMGLYYGDVRNLGNGVFFSKEDIGDLDK